jgi:hypothetical protein
MPGAGMPKPAALVSMPMRCLALIIVQVSGKLLKDL